MFIPTAISSLQHAASSVLASQTDTPHSVGAMSPSTVSLLPSLKDSDGKLTLIHFNENPLFTPCWLYQACNHLGRGLILGIKPNLSDNPFSCFRKRIDIYCKDLSFCKGSSVELLFDVIVGP